MYVNMCFFSMLVFLNPTVHNFNTFLVFIYIENCIIRFRVVSNPKDFSKFHFVCVFIHKLTLLYLKMQSQEMSAPNLAPIMRTLVGCRDNSNKDSEGPFPCIARPG